MKPAERGSASRPLSKIIFEPQPFVSCGLTVGAEVVRLAGNLFHLLPFSVLVQREGIGVGNIVRFRLDSLGLNSRFGKLNHGFHFQIKGLVKF